MENKEFDDALANIKLSLGIWDLAEDRLLKLILRDTRQHLLNEINEQDVPAQLQYIVENVAVAKYNKRGSEGFTSESMGNHSVSLNSDDFAPYRRVINQYIDASEGASSARVGKARFY